MIKLFNNLKSKKGFTLIELIVVLAVLAIIMAIAIPSFMGIQDEARVKGDAATAAQITKVARLQEASNNDGVAITKTKWDYNMMAWPKPRTGESFDLSGGGTNATGAEIKYIVKWTPTVGRYTGKQQQVEEGEEFKMNK